MSKIGAHVSVVVAACLVVAGSMWAADDAADKKKDKGAGKAKAAQLAEQQFKKLDSNADGQPTLGEFEGMKRQLKSFDSAEAAFKMLDRDSDGKISVEEFKNKPAEFRFRTLDKDGDGCVTFDEFKGRRTEPEAVERAENQFKGMDKDGDKKVTLEEFQAAQKRQKAGGKKGKGKRAKDS